MKTMNAVMETEKVNGGCFVQMGVRQLFKRRVIQIQCFFITNLIT